MSGDVTGIAPVFRVEIASELIRGAWNQMGEYSSLFAARARVARRQGSGPTGYDRSDNDLTSWKAILAVAVAGSYEEGGAS